MSFHCRILHLITPVLFFLVHTVSSQDDTSNSTVYAQPTYSEAVGYGFLATTITNLAAILGLMFYPLQRWRGYPSLISFMVAIAVGSLFTSAVIVLIPEALELTQFQPPDSDDNWYIGGCVAICVAAAAFFILEYMLETIPELVCTKGEHASMNVLKVDDQMIVKHDDDVLHFRSPNFFRRIFNLKPIVWMVIIGDGFHNFMDGLAIGVAFKKRIRSGISISLAILCEEVPHELGDIAVLLHQNMSLPVALTFNFLSACSAYIGFAIGVTADLSPTAQSYIFAITAGFFLYISLADMLPEMRSTGKAHDRKSLRGFIDFIIHLCGLGFGFACILLITIFSYAFGD